MKTFRSALLFTALIAVSAPYAEARYIDFPGSRTVMSMNDGENNSAHFFYTIKPYWSVGYEADYWRTDEFFLQTAQTAWLLKRWNLPDAQANLYARGGIGAAYSDAGSFDGHWQAAGSAGIAFDAENRRLYGAYENRYVEAGDIFDGFEQKARVGVAPYVAEYGALHTWLILQLDHRPWSDDEISWTPMVRFFKGDILVEAGVSDNGKPLFNVMIRF